MTSIHQKCSCCKKARHLCERKNIPKISSCDIETKKLTVLETMECSEATINTLYCDYINSMPPAADETGGTRSAAAPQQTGRSLHLRRNERRKRRERRERRKAAAAALGEDEAPPSTVAASRSLSFQPNLYNPSDPEESGSGSGSTTGDSDSEDNGCRRIKTLCNLKVKGDMVIKDDLLVKDCAKVKHKLFVGQLCIDGIDIDPVAANLCTERVCLDFEQFATGETDFSLLDGVALSTNNPGAHPLMIFDSANPNPLDLDLGAPNQNCPGGGPGVGNGGKPNQPGKNCEPLGKILIISSDGNSAAPNDYSGGGDIVFTFDAPVLIDEVQLLDIDENGTTIELLRDAVVLDTHNVPNLGNNSFQAIDAPSLLVDQLKIHLAGSGAVPAIKFIRCRARDGGVGQRGPQGYAGVNGIQGYDGQTGAQGFSGADGADGADGQNGAQGFSGADGADGTDGQNGAQGFSGADGADGVDGQNGAQGFSGADGADGADGQNGAQGFSGTDGTDGADGQNGAQGYSGLQGYSGIQGTAGDGQKGLQGFAGVQGYRGVQGFSAERGAQGHNGDQGFDGKQGLCGKQGTMAERGNQGYRGGQGLSGLMGDQGEDGPQGDRGCQGHNGDQGRDGPQGYRGEQGEVGPRGAQAPPGGDQGKVGPQGFPGADGADGADGQNGAQGFSGADGADGTDGQNGAQGYSGLQGFQAERGNQGYSGIQGTAGDGQKGNQGFAGPQGYRGLQGFSAERGAQGYNGDQGFDGKQGLCGKQGTMAERGNQGYRGGQGLSGLMGDQGEDGPQGDRGCQGHNGDQGRDGPQGFRGEQGEVGPRGAQAPPGGDQGKVGPQGTDGEQGYRGLQGFQAERGVQGYSGIQGMAGDGQKGQQGFDGAQGYRGLQGFVAERGAQGYLGGQGIEGRKGSQGYDGQQGVVGSRGTQGYNGSQGFDGSQGLRGRQGFAGPQGLSGLMGDQGEDGPQGVVGCQGSKGDQGYRGLQGFRGEQGEVGFKGMQAAANGEQGYKGMQGYDGKQGHNGTQGLMGKQGFVAERGAQGYLGGQGVDGRQGLNGRQGIDGMRGVQGFDGLQGLDGRQGVDGARGTQGYNGSQGYDGSQGVEGKQGLRGRQGFAGQQGYRGLQGYDGQQGVAGSRGVQGYDGSQGFAGPQGLSGLMGDQGEDGPQGIMGCQGRKGDQGYRGHQGYRGEQGEVGFKGMQAAANGEQGHRGGQGPIGAALSGFLCEMIKNAEQACDASFCAPDNPFITVFDQNCDPGKDCRAVARPAGTHFPCATFQVQSTAAFDQTNIIVDNVPDDVNVFALKYNPYGCEFVATWFVVGETVGKLIRFVVDQDCQLRNATTGVIASTPVDLGAVATVTGTPSGTNESIQHVICHDGVTYVASRRALTIDPFGLNNSIGLASTPLAVAVQSTNGHYAYVAVRDVASIRVVNLSNNSTTAFNLSTGGNANCCAVDALVCGNVLIVALINYGAGPNDAVALYDFSSNPLNPVLLSTLVLTGQNSGNNSKTGATIWPGLVHHPTKQIIYVTGRKSNAVGPDLLYLNSVGYEQLALIKKKTLTFTADPQLNLVTQKALRPIYRDGALQMVYLQSSNCALSTIRVNDNNPLDIETVSTVSLTPSPSFNSCYERFASLSSGALILIAYQELGVFKPTPLGRLYINDKPLSNQTPQGHCELIIKRGEVARDELFCAPHNPLIQIYEADPCGTLTECRAVTRPAGTHLPCATLQVDSANVRELLAGATNAPVRNVLIEQGCANQFGCEYGIAYIDASGSTRFGVLVVDQAKALKNADGTAFNVNSFAFETTTSPVDIGCFDGQLYLLTTSSTEADNLLIKMKSPTKKIAIPVGAAAAAGFPFSGVRNTAMTYDKLRNRILIGNASGQIYAVSVESFTLVSVLPIVAVTDLLIGDMKAVGDALFIVGSTDAAADDRYIVINLNDVTTSIVNLPCNNRRSFQSDDIQAGIVAHAIAPVLYVAQTLSDNSGLSITCVNLDPNDPSFIQFENSNPVDQSKLLILDGLTDASSTADNDVLQRVRPRYCDGALQFTFTQGVQAIFLSGSTSGQWETLTNGDLQCKITNPPNTAGGNCDLQLQNVCGPATLTFEYSFQQANAGDGNFVVELNSVPLPGISVPTAGFVPFSISIPAGSTNVIRWVGIFNTPAPATSGQSIDALVRNIEINGVPITAYYQAGTSSFAPNPVCPYKSLLVTACPDENDPCQMTLVASNALPSSVAEAGQTYRGFINAPSGCILLAGQTALTLAQPDECNPRLLNKKPLLTQNPQDFCKLIVEKSEVPCDETFCAPCNPMVAACEADPCGSLSERRVVQRPLGTHLPCATLQVDSADVRELLAGATNAPVRNVLIEQGCANQFGCEYGIAYIDASGSTRFGVLVVDQAKALKNADGTAFNVNSFAVETTTSPVDIGCFDGELYLLTTSTTQADNLLIKMKNPAQQIAIPIVFPPIVASLPFTSMHNTAMTYDKLRNRILIGNAGGQIYVVDAETFTLSNNGNSILDVGGFIGDVKVRGDNLVILATGDITLPDDALVVYLPTMVTSTTQLVGQSFAADDIQPGIAAHPLCNNIFYLVQTAANNNHGMILSCLAIKDSHSAQFTVEIIDTIAGVVDVQPTLADDMLQRLRPRYCDGVMQLMPPGMVNPATEWRNATVFDNLPWEQSSSGNFEITSVGNTSAATDLLLTSVCGPATLTFEWELTTSGSTFIDFIVNGSTIASLNTTTALASVTHVLPNAMNNITWYFNNSTGAGNTGRVTNIQINGIPIAVPDAPGTLDDTQPVLGPNPACPPARHLLTYCVSDNDPCNVERVANNVVPANVAPADSYPRHLRTPDGCLLIAAASELRLAVPADCEQRYITKKLLTTQNPDTYCKTVVEKAEVACDETFCAPCNPMVAACEADPCGSLAERRVVQRPLGTHLPCTTLQVDSANVRELLSGATEAPDGAVLIEKGCTTGFGCEYGIAYTTTAATTRFGVLVVDQDKNLKHSDGSPFDVNLLESAPLSLTSDIGCFGGQLYLLTSSQLIKMKDPAQKINITSYGLAMTYDKRRKRILIGSASGIIFGVNAETFTLITPSPLLTIPGVVSLIGDMKAVGDSLFIVLTEDSLQDDRYVVINLNDLTVPINVQANGRRSFDLTDVKPGIVAHPIAPVLYVAQTLSDNSAVAVTCVKLDPDNPTFIQFENSNPVDQSQLLILDGKIDISRTANNIVLERLRPRYCDGALQAFYAQAVKPAVWSNSVIGLSAWTYETSPSRLQSFGADSIATMALSNICGPASFSFDAVVVGDASITFIEFDGTQVVFTNTTTQSFSYSVGPGFHHFTWISTLGTTGSASISNVLLNGVDITAEGPSATLQNTNCRIGRLATACIDDNDPCNVQLVSNNVLPPLLLDASRAYPQHVAAPDGCLIFAGDTTLTLAQPDECNPRLLNKKPLLTQNPQDFCKLIVEKSEVPCDEAFCAPCNPMVAACEADPCGSLAERRVVQRPLGTHLPCATLQVNSANVRELLAGAIEAPVSDVTIEKGCSNQFGCEYGIAYSRAAGGVRFGVLVIDQDKNLKNTDGTAFDVNLFQTETTGFPTDIGCFDGQLYLLTTKKLIKMKSPTQTLAINNGICMTYDKRRNRILIGVSGTQLWAVNASTFTLVTPSPAITFADISYSGDMKVIGDSLFIVGEANDGSRYVVVDLNNFAVTINVHCNGRRSLSILDIYSGIVAHPIAPVLYVAQTLSDRSAVAITCVKLDPNNPLFIEFENSSPLDKSKLLLLDGPINLNDFYLSTNAPPRLRPRYCDGALQAFYPQYNPFAPLWFNTNQGASGPWQFMTSPNRLISNNLVQAQPVTATMTLVDICGPATLSFDALVTGDATIIFVKFDGTQQVFSNFTTQNFTFSVGAGTHQFRWIASFGTTTDGIAVISNILLNGVDITASGPSGVAQGPSGQKPNGNCRIARLATAHVDDNDPCNVQLVSNNALPISVVDPSRAYPQHVAAPDGCLLFAGLTTLTLAQPDECNPRMLNKKPLLTQNPHDHCKLIVKKAEQACDQSFCAPLNPYVTVFEQDCDPAKDCRAVTRPAGTHFPCATLTVATTPKYTEADVIADLLPNDVTVWRLKENPFGCEFVATYFVSSANPRLQRFVVDQNCQLRNATTGHAATTVADLENFKELTGRNVITDLRCHNGITYVATLNGLTIEPFSATPKNITVAGALTMNVAISNAGFAYLGDRTNDAMRVNVINLSTDAVSSFTLTGTVNTTATDVYVCGNYLIVAQINYENTTNKDAVALYDIAANPTAPPLISVSVLNQNSGGGQEVPTFTITPSIVHHPTKKVVYVSGISAVNLGNENFYVNVLSYESGTLQFVDRISVKTNSYSGVTDRRGRLNLHNGLIQFSNPAPTGLCQLTTVRIADDNPLSIALVSSTVVPDPNNGDCYARLAVSPSGCLILTSRSNNPGVLGIFEPAPRARRYINDKPMNLPSNNVALLALQNAAIDVLRSSAGANVLNSSDFVQFRSEVTFVSNMFTVGLQNPLLQNNNIFTAPAGRKIMVHFDLSIYVDNNTTGAPLLAIYSDDGNGNQRTQLYAFQTVTAVAFFVSFGSNVIVSAQQSLQIQYIGGAGTIADDTSSFSMQYLYDL